MTELSTIPISRLNNTELDTKIKTEIDKNGIDLSTITTNCITEIPQDIKLELKTKYSWFNSGFLIYLYTDSASVSVNDNVYGDNINDVIGTVTQVSGNTITIYFPEEYDAIPAEAEVDFTRDSSADINGILTLKAGSKVYVPNGPGVFDTITTTSDLTTSGVAFPSSTVFVVYINGVLAVKESSQIASGSTPPSSGSVTDWWYDTTNNVIKSTTDWNTWNVLQNCSLPFGLITLQPTIPYITSINQIFNGFGYMGSTEFVLPGVKGLVPNGRNEDGTLKNIEVVSEKVITYTRTINGGPFVLGFARGATNNGFQSYVSSEVQPTSGYVLWYKPSDNFIYRIEQGVLAGIYDKCIYGTEIRNESSPYNITSFNTKTLFHAVDYNDIVNKLDKSDIQFVSALPASPVPGVYYFVKE